MSRIKALCAVTLATAACQLNPTFDQTSTVTDPVPTVDGGTDTQVTVCGTAGEKHHVGFSMTPCGTSIEDASLNAIRPIAAGTNVTIYVDSPVGAVVAANSVNNEVASVIASGSDWFRVVTKRPGQARLQLSTDKGLNDSITINVVPTRGVELTGEWPGMDVAVMKSMRPLSFCALPETGDDVVDGVGDIFLNATGSVNAQIVTGSLATSDCEGRQGTAVEFSPTALGVGQVSVERPFGVQAGPFTVAPVTRSFKVIVAEPADLQAEFSRPAVHFTRHPASNDVQANIDARMLSVTLKAQGVPAVGERCDFHSTPEGLQVQDFDELFGEEELATSVGYLISPPKDAQGHDLGGQFTLNCDIAGRTAGTIQVTID